MMFGIFSCASRHLYSFFEEMYIQNFCPLLNWIVCLFIFEFKGSSYVLDISPLSGLSFHFLDGVLWRTKVFTFFFYLFFYCLFLRERERERQQGRGRERGRHRLWNRLQAPSCQHRAQCGAQTHELWNHDLSQSQALDQLSHPGVLKSFYF